MFDNATHMFIIFKIAWSITVAEYQYDINVILSNQFVHNLLTALATLSITHK